MTNTRYTKAHREALSASRRSTEIARRSALSEVAAMDELADFIIDGVVPMSSGRRIPVAEFIPAWRRGELLLNV